MVLLLVVKPVEGWCSVASSVLPQVIEMVVRGMVNKPKEEKPKEEKKEEPKSEPEKKRSGGTVGSASKRADGIATKGKTRGKMV
jgi:hypothetical protein